MSSLDGVSLCSSAAQCASQNVHVFEEGLSEHANIKLQNQSDAIQTERIVSTAGVNMEALGQMLEALRPQPAPAPPVRTLAIVLHKQRQQKTNAFEPRNNNSPRINSMSCSAYCRPGQR